MKAPLPTQRPHRRAKLRAGQVWVTRDQLTRTATRRIVAVVDDGQPPDRRRKVCYSTGSNAHHWCLHKAFARWIHRYDAVLTRPSRKRSLVLKAPPRRHRV